MKRLLKILLVLIIVSIITPVNATTPVLCDRADMENYGVNKKWQITDKNINNVKITPCVNANDKIYDFSDVLTDTEEEQLREEINEYIKKTNMDLVIVIDRIPYYTDQTNEVYAADFYDYNDFGIDFKNYSGTLLLRNTYEEDPYYDIYTFGEAQLYYDYNRLQTILDGIYDDLHGGLYKNGFSHFIDYVDVYYDRGISLNNYTIDENGYLQKKYVYPLPFTLIGSIVITFIVMLILIRKNKMIMKATQAEEYMDHNTIHITNRQDNFISTHTTSYTTSSSSGGGGGGGGFHSSGGSSGGGHSSGGGRHG